MMHEVVPIFRRTLYAVATLNFCSVCAWFGFADTMLDLNKTEKIGNGQNNTFLDF